MKKHLKRGIFALAITLLSASYLNAQSVLLDTHSDAAGATTWNITTNHPNELILIAADGYGGSSPLSIAPGTVTVNGNNATYITEGQYSSGDAWTASVWAYVAPTAGTYTLTCTESGLDAPFYFNYASAVYDPYAPLGLSDILIGGHDSNSAMNTITTAITTTKKNAFVYGTVIFNDNGGTGTLNWNGGLTELDHDYISNGVDCAQADSTIAVPGLQTITVTDIGVTNPFAAIVLVAVQSHAKDSVFVYTGAMQTWTVPCGVDSVQIDCFGAQGVAIEYTPGFGGEARGVLPVTPGQVLNIFVGGQSGWNGGGLGQNGANGGDGSDVRLGGVTLANRIIVAGGGGGAGGDNWQCTGGVFANGGGGTPVGNNFVGGGGGQGYTNGTGCGADGANNGGAGGGGGCHGGGGGGGGLTSGGAGATATCGPWAGDSGSLGQGGASYNAPGCSSEATGGGGGGYYGGGGAAGYNCGAGQGGGGSSWTGTLNSPYFNSGSWTGNGQIALTWIIDTVKSVTGNIIANVKCHGDNTGIASAIVTGGQAPYTYNWAPSGGSSDTATGLSAGTYTVTVNAACGSSVSSTVTITQPAASLLVTIGHIKQPGCKDSLWAIVTGGGMPYSFLWSPGGYTNDTIGHLCDGNYKVVVTDNNGCKDSASILIPAAVNELSNNGGFNIYPVPASNILNIDVRDNGFAFSSLVVFDITGRQILDEKLNSNSTHTALDVSKLENGIYFMKIISSDNQSIIRFEITR